MRFRSEKRNENIAEDEKEAERMREEVGDTRTLTHTPYTYSFSDSIDTLHSVILDTYIKN